MRSPGACLYALDGSGMTATLKVCVTTPVTKVVILDAGGDPVSKLIASRGTGKIELDSDIDPDDAAPIVKWTSSSSSIASADADEGTVTLHMRGTFTIT